MFQSIFLTPNFLVINRYCGDKWWKCYLAWDRSRSSCCNVLSLLLRFFYHLVALQKYCYKSVFTIFFGENLVCYLCVDLLRFSFYLVCYFLMLFCYLNGCSLWLNWIAPKMKKLEMEQHLSSFLVCLEHLYTFCHPMLEIS